MLQQKNIQTTAPNHLQDSTLPGMQQSKMLWLAAPQTEEDEWGAD